MQAKNLKVLAAAVVIALPMVAQAESTIALTPPAPATMSTSARVNINVVIPRFLFLQVGTGTFLTNVGTIDTVVFNVPVANVGNGTPVAGTGGDLTGGRVTVRLLGNVGNVNLGATAAALTNGTGETIPWSQISVATSGVTHPAINGAAAAFTASARVVDVSGDWTYGYLNTATPAEGTYSSQITYTAVSL
jgi:hypothetical protein